MSHESISHCVYFSSDSPVGSRILFRQYFTSVIFNFLYIYIRNVSVHSTLYCKTHTRTYLPLYLLLLYLCNEVTAANHSIRARIYREKNAAGRHASIRRIKPNRRASVCACIRWLNNIMNNGEIIILCVKPLGAAHREDCIKSDCLRTKGRNESFARGRVSAGE